MFSSTDLDSELKAIYMSGQKGSEVLLFRRNVGLVGRYNVPHTPEELEALILTMKQECATDDLKVNSWSLVERVLQKYLPLRRRREAPNAEYVTSSSLGPDQEHARLTSCEF